MATPWHAGLAVAARARSKGKRRLMITQPRSAAASWFRSMRNCWP